MLKHTHSVQNSFEHLAVTEYRLLYVIHICDTSAKACAVQYNVPVYPILSV